MTQWASLRDAYGSAEQVPALLARAATAGTDADELWGELWGRLCHQGTVYSASYAALPALAQMSAQRDPTGYLAAMHLAADIVASNDGPEDAAVVRRRYEQEVADLRAVATRNLQHTKDDTEFVYGLQALMAFEDGGLWQRNLHHLADGEASLACPSCGEDLLMNLDSTEPRVASFADASLASTTVTPHKPSAHTIEGRLLALAQTNDRTAISAQLPYLFGDSTCPDCHAPFEIPPAFA
jgi:hypothetical protein